MVRTKPKRLKPHHLTSYLGTLTTSSQTTKNGAARAVKRVFNWAVQEGYIDSSPLAAYRAPKAQPRDVYIGPAQWVQFVELAKPELRRIVEFMKETGCRPQEAREALPEHLDGHSIIFDREDSKGKRERRVVLLNDKAFQLVQDLPFKNTRGKPWTETALNQAFDVIENQLEFKIFPYAIRHTVITDWLVAGLSPLEVANLAGHSDLAMIQRVYSHLSRKSEHMRKRLNDVSSVVTAALPVSLPQKAVEPS